MTTDDLVCLVAFDPFGANIPVDDKPVLVEHEDSVVGDALDKHAEIALTLVKLGGCFLPLLGAFLDILLEHSVELMESLLGFLAVRYVDHHVHGPDKVTRRVMQGS